MKSEKKMLIRPAIQLLRQSHYEFDRFYIRDRCIMLAMHYRAAAAKAVAGGSRMVRIGLWWCWLAKICLSFASARLCSASWLCHHHRSPTTNLIPFPHSKLIISECAYRVCLGWLQARKCGCFDPTLANFRGVTVMMASRGCIQFGTCNAAL